MKLPFRYLTVLALLIAVSAQAGGRDRVYAVTITNITPGQSFTPILVATHRPGFTLFELGTPPSQGVADMAEGGDTSGIAADLMDSGAAFDMVSTEGDLIGPGESRTVHVAAPRRPGAQLSLAGMLLPTNDSFVAVNGMRLPRWHVSSMMAPAYDAGAEENDELCANIPGPVCGGEPFSAGLAEGYVHVSRGIQGVGDLPPETYDWRNPVARITVQRAD